MYRDTFSMYFSISVILLLKLLMAASSFCESLCWCDSFSLCCSGVEVVRLCGVSGGVDFFFFCFFFLNGSDDFFFSFLGDALVNYVLHNNLHSFHEVLDLSDFSLKLC